MGGTGAKLTVAFALCAGVLVGSPAEANAAATATFVDGHLTVNGQSPGFACVDSFVAFDPGVTPPPTAVPCAAVLTIDVIGTENSDWFTIAGSFPAVTHVEISTGGEYDQLYVEIDATVDRIDLGSGNDFIRFGDQVEAVVGGPGNDTLLHDRPRGSSRTTLIDGDDGVDEVRVFLGSGAARPGVLAGVGESVLLYADDEAWLLDAVTVEQFTVIESLMGQTMVVVPSRTTAFAWHQNPPLADPIVVWLDTRGLGVNGTFVEGFAPVSFFVQIDLRYFNGRPFEYIDAVYSAFLGRPVDPDGFAYWDYLLGYGVSRETFVASMLRLPEHADLAVRHEYEAILHRGADPAGIAYWSRFLQGGGSPDDLRALLYGSPEYLQNFGGGTTSGFFDALYSSVLHRIPDPDGRAYWTGLLNRGMNRVDVARAILVLPEPIRVAVTGLYSELLGRSPGTAELDYWQSVWTARGEFTVVAALAGSGEYYDLVAPIFL